MVNPIFTEPVEGDNPCGPDMQWDTNFVQISQDFEMAKVQTVDTATIDGELAEKGDLPTFDEIIEEIEALLKKTKDLRLMAIYAEASWYNGGLPDFAAAMEGMTTAIEAWADPEAGIHPRADEEDSDLGMRVAPVGKLVKRIPMLTNIIGWGSKQPEISERKAVSAELRGVFDFWTHRLEGAFGDDLPSSLESWKTLQKILGDDSVAEEAGGDLPAVGGGTVAGGDAWDTVERAAELMAQQNRHSPALPVLRMLSHWRALGIIEIANDMRASGVSLEQLLESVKKQTTGVGGASGVVPVAPLPSAAAPAAAPQHPGLS